MARIARALPEREPLDTENLDALTAGRFSRLRRHVPAVDEQCATGWLHVPA